MPTVSNRDSYKVLCKNLESQRKTVLETGLPTLTNCQGIKPGQLFILTSWNEGRWNTMETRDKLERGEFDHLKKGRVYKFTFRFGNQVSWIDQTGHMGYFPRTKGLNLLRVPSMLQENRVGFVQSNQMVIYLETVRSGHGLFHKIVAGDQVGYIPCNQNDYRLNRITSRMLRRMEEGTTREEKVCGETKGDKV